MKTSTCKAISLALGVFVSTFAWADISAVVDDCNGCHGKPMDRCADDRRCTGVCPR